MNHDPSLWSFISHASPVVKLVMLVLLAASIASWTVIIQRYRYFKERRLAARHFEKRFWSGVHLQELFQELSKKSAPCFGLARIFLSGFDEFDRLHRQEKMQGDAVMMGAERSMRMATQEEIDALERHLGFLATVGSTSPYIGLFGTVWGIMSSFRALGAAGQASIATVAPGIAEALIATAIGLFAAIPAVIAYNRFTHDLEHLTHRYDHFQEEMNTLFHREAYRNTVQTD